MVLRTRNVNVLTAPYRQVMLRLMSFAHDELPYEGSKREDGIDGTKFQNIGTLWQCTGVLVAFQIDAGAWDDGDDQQIIRALRGKHVWIHSVEETGRKVVGTNAAGTDYDYWTTGTGTMFPRKVVVTWSAADFTIGAQLWRRRTLTLTDEKPTIGIAIS